MAVYLLLVLLAVSALQVPAASVPEELGRQFPQARTRTVTKVVTTTASGATTSVLSTKLVCASLDATTSTQACRRKRQYWGVPFLVPLDNEENQFQPFQSLNPTQVYRVEPSVLPEFRNRPASFVHPYAPVPYASPFAVQSSLDQMEPVHLASRFFGAYRYAAVSSLFSNLLASILNPAVTETSTSTVYTSTVTSTSYTTTVSYGLTKVPCIPAGVTTCPPSSG